ncbi:acyl carrier protein [Klebsiella phage 0507-KN2-1]|uniref:Acyl carrier protein n=2 Tax=Taipeivirus TaxID=2731621 RepID=A0A5Q2F517_9CAUD|nr:acyl carrier protein [Klebsiella phage 0507-KN2-1]YP_009884787.1 acyl carrier protein [Klebsiella phage UPM 2146]QGF20711.1 acyl carrier protein [Klebsiella phage UPM 2146]WOZ56619.1 hypothetical protein GHCGIGKI_00850 [Klebsiella phage P01]BAN78490.1 putative acyl carrier protein [Klebsiella phage 0507-KN2-1]
MSKNVSYIDVMRFLVQYASDNLNMELWREKKHSVTIQSAIEKIEDQLDTLAPLRVKEHLGGDELDAIEIIMDLEEEYDVEITDHWIGSHKDDPTLGELAEHVVHLLK